jgi:hypothetical protein
MATLAVLAHPDIRIQPTVPKEKTSVTVIPKPELDNRTHVLCPVVVLHVLVPHALQHLVHILNMPTVPCVLDAVPRTPVIKRLIRLPHNPVMLSMEKHAIFACPERPVPVVLIPAVMIVPEILYHQPAAQRLVRLARPVNMQMRIIRRASATTHGKQKMVPMYVFATRRN